METTKINKRVLLSLSLFALLFLASPVSCASSDPSSLCTTNLQKLECTLIRYVGKTNMSGSHEAISQELATAQDILKILYREVKSSNKAVVGSVMSGIDKLLVKAEKKLYEVKPSWWLRSERRFLRKQLHGLHKLQDQHTKCLLGFDRVRGSWRRLMRRPIYNSSKWLLGASFLSFVGISSYGWLIEKMNKNTEYRKW
jgi:hypothetical protein